MGTLLKQCLELVESTSGVMISQVKKNEMEAFDFLRAEAPDALVRAVLRKT